MPHFTSKRNVSEKPQHLEKGKAKRISPDKKKSNSLQQPQFTLRDDDEELPPERCQHIQFMDCDKQVGRVILECWHCHQGIISEYTGEPVMGEYKGRPSLRDFQQINYPILWGGRLARPRLEAGKMPTSQEVVEYFFIWKSLIQLKIQCPNCEQTAIRLTTGQVLSTTAIPSPWQQ